MSVVQTPEKNVKPGFVAMQDASDPNLLDLGLLDEVSRLLALLPLWQTVGEGEPLTLSIGVDVINLVSFQWYFNGQPIAGANKGTLFIPSVHSAQVGRYQLRATLLGTTLASIPTDVQINATDDTVDRSVAAFDKLGDATALLAPVKAISRTKSGATAHGYSGTQIFSTIGATKDPGEPNHCGIPGGASEWYALQLPTNGTAVVDTDGSNFDTVLAVYIGPGDSYSTLTNVTCDNDSGANGKTSRVTFQAASGRIYYIAVDGVNGASGTVKLNYIVGTPVAIAAQPISCTVPMGASATLSVGATGFPAPRYQWMFNGANLPNATNASLILNTVTETNLGNYVVRVTNTFNAITSAAVNIGLEGPLRFSPPRAASDGFHISLTGPSGTNYVVEFSTNLVVWMALTTNRAQIGLAEYIDSTATDRARFYRARPIP